MANLAAERGQKPFSAKHLRLPLVAALKAWKGTIACFDATSPGNVNQGGPSSTLERIGVFKETVDNTAGGAGALLVDVDLDYEVQGQFFANDGTVTIAQIGQDVYVLDNHTVTANAVSGGVQLSKAGRCWMVDAQFGVAVEPSDQSDEPRVIWDKEAADAAAATATAEHTIYVADGHETIDSLQFMPDAAVALNAANYASIIVQVRNGAGGAPQVVATLTTAATNLTAWIAQTLGALAHNVLAPGSLLTVQITKTGTGVVIPSGAIYAMIKRR